MLDGHGRGIDYVRISVTDRCNLRCVYCMPEEGVEHMAHESILTYEEILRLCRIFVALGITKFKLTGGEPLVRKGLPGLVSRLKRIPGVESVTLTTNGILLGAHLPELMRAGIDGINISLDTLDPERYTALTRRGGLSDALAGLEAALAQPGLNVKVNCVAMEGHAADWLALAELARARSLAVRFIEPMPIGLGRGLAPCGEESVAGALEERYGPLIPYHGRLGNGPCRYYTLPGFVGKIGFISAVSHQFCDKCNRVRLTATGYLKTCLQYDRGVQLSPLLKEGDEVLRNAIAAAILDKPAEHQFSQRQVPQREDRIMSQIGG